MNYTYNIIKEYKYQLILIYIYMSICQLLYLAGPYVLGKMIDGLLVKEYFWMGCFIVIAAFENIFTYKRMIYDTKIYTTIYNNIVLKYLKNNENTNPSTKIARIELSSDIINFLENDIHFFIYAIITIVGTLFFIFIQNPLTAFIVLSATIPIFIIVCFFYKKIKQCTIVSNNAYENKVEILTQNNFELIESFYKRRKKIHTHRSTIQGKNLASLNITKTSFLILGIVVFTHSSINLSLGQSVSMYTYINQFLISLMSIPMGVETFTRIKDIISRIKE